MDYIKERSWEGSVQCVVFLVRNHLSPEQGSFHSLSCSWTHVASHKSQVSAEELCIGGLCKERSLKQPFSLSSQRIRSKKRRTPSLPLKLLARTPNLQPLKHGGIPPAVHSPVMPRPKNPCSVRRSEDLPAQKCCVGAVLCLSHPALLDGQNSLQSHSSWSPAMPQSHGSSVVLLVFLLPT